MGTKSYAVRISDAQVMTSGLYNNVSKTSRRGWDNKAIEELETVRHDAAKLNDEQEKLKADLKIKTAELDAEMIKLDELMSEAKKIVKMDFPQEQWKEFGVADKR